MIDNELVITIRVRVPDDLNRLDQAALAGNVSGTVVGALGSTAQAIPATLLGIDFTFPTYDEIPLPRPTGDTHD